MEKEQQKLNKYFIYCRKSTDSEDRQIQSLSDQIRILQEMAEKKGLMIVETLQEAKSAKAPGRPVFTKMIERISKGEANGIITWKLNRLARNPIDGGTISWLLQQGVIKEILTPEKSHYPNDNALIMSVELGIANQFIRDLSSDAKRGIKTRATQKGYPNGVAPIGYLNDLVKAKGDRGWKVDEERFPIIKQILKMFATGKYSVRQMTSIANEEMGLRTFIRKKQGGKKIVVSYMDVILKNPVYAGFFFLNTDNSRHEVNKEIPRMISEETYWKIQKILGNRGRPRPHKNIKAFAYTGLTKCGGCGGSVTAEEKYQLICSSCKHKFAYASKNECPKCKTKIKDMEDPTYLHYTYYHCTKKKRELKCKERSVVDTKIDETLADYYKKNLKISADLSKWCIENLRVIEKEEKQNDYEIKASLQKTLTSKEKELSELALMRARGLLDDESFITAQNTIKEDISALKRKLSEFEHLDPEKAERIYQAFDLSQGIDEIIRNGTPEEKKSVLLEIGSNLTLKDKTINVYNSELYSAIINGLHLAKSEIEWFEPENYQAEQEQNASFEALRSTMLRG
ncbi:MAG: recombinase family protein [Burkholderiales bacterium]|nr:recombinase family protein [Burkholderiales bacterium]